MPRSTRPSAKAAQLRLVEEGTLAVAVRRPIEPPLPSGIAWGWSLSRTDGRPAFHLRANPTQMVRVSYQLLEDPVQLADLAARSLRNKSGTAVRGYARAEAGRVTHVIPPQAVRALVQHAANLDTRRTLEGPAQVRVKLLEPLVGHPPMCQDCKHPFAEHELLEKISLGDWGDWDDNSRAWDPEKPRTDAYYLCPLEATS